MAYMKMLPSYDNGDNNNNDDATAVDDYYDDDDDDDLVFSSPPQGICPLLVSDPGIISLPTLRGSSKNLGGEPMMIMMRFNKDHNEGYIIKRNHNHLLG